MTKTTETQEQLEPTIEIEKSVLGALMLGEESELPLWTQAIRPEMYSTEIHKQAAMAIDEILGAKELPDMITVIDRLKSWGVASASTEVIAIASSASTIANLGHHSRILVERYQKRTAQAELRSLLSAIDRKQVCDIREDLELVSERLRPLVEVSTISLLRDEVRDVYKELVRSEGNERRKNIRTGIDNLDRKVFLEPGEQTILAGRPSMGKTALACNIARNVAGQGRGVVAFFSLEMSKQSLVRRLLSSEAKISNWKLAEAAKDGRLTEPANRLYGLDLWLDDRPGMTVSAMKAALAKFDKVALVIVDYLGLIKTGNEERHDLRIGAITKASKEMAKRTNCHVLMLSQLNRSLEKRSPPIPQLSDLRDSGNIEEDADNVILLYRPGYYSDDADPEETQARVAKQRNGPTGAVRLRWKRESQTFGDW